MPVCELCEREVHEVTRHHLIPRKLHRKKRFQKQFSSEELQETVDLCRLCHRQLHKLISHRELGETYHSLAQLRAHPGIQTFLVWARKQK